MWTKGIHMSHVIMIVDDSAIVRMQLASVLKKQGYETLEVSNGTDALSLAKERTDISLIITDVNMPGMTGLELLSELRASEAHREMPVFVLTTESTGHIQEEGREKGATAWIVKPFNEEALLEGIAHVLKA